MKKLQFKRFANTTLAGMVGSSGELIIDTTTHSLTIHDGVTAGGFRQATENYVNNALSNAGVGEFPASAFIKANSSYAHANAAFVQANGAVTNTTTLQGGLNTANTNITNVTNSVTAAFLQANTPSYTANSGALYANAAFIQANAAFLIANTPQAIANSASLYANGAFVQANAAYVLASTPQAIANSAALYANAAFIQANAAFLVANTPTAISNSASLYANGAFVQANAAFTAANNAAATIPQNAQSTSYTLVLTDAGKHIYSTNTTTQIINLPNNGTVSWPVGSTIMLVLKGTGAMNVIPATGISMYAANSSTAKTYANVYSYGMATLLNVGANTWFINGAGVS